MKQQVWGGTGGLQEVWRSLEVTFLSRGPGVAARHGGGGGVNGDGDGRGLQGKMTFDVGVNGSVKRKTI